MTQDGEASSALAQLEASKSTPVYPDLKTPKRIHLVGIGGAGMSSIATVLAEMGHSVSGSDLKPSHVLDQLRARGVAVGVGHSRANVGEVDFLAISTAIPPTNPEVLAAQELGIPVLNRATILGAISTLKKTLAVGGTHGKTTTASLLALILSEAGLQPSFIIGGELNEIGGSAHLGAGEFMVIEADESDGTFTRLDRFATIVTNVEPDHLSHHGDFQSLFGAFEEFVRGSTLSVVFAGDSNAARLSGRPGVVTFGEPGNDYEFRETHRSRSGTSFELLRAGELVGELSVPVPGRHNALNAAAASVLALEIGVEISAIRAAVARFGGVARRFQHRGNSCGVTFIDDYAHLPTETKAALQAAQVCEFERVVCVFQPHRFTRTRDVWRDFEGAFAAADVLVITDIYPSGEAPIPGVTARLILKAVGEGRRSRPSRLVFLPDREQVLDFLLGELRSGDLCLTLGAGDLSSLPDQMLERIECL